ncbi:hypothetical protein RB195_011845 [Necator americanus]|uniref:Uncharacterized protein n=1 Tax=Necator americanus TaxID=51031 RepID=A0ABR1D4D4_NECAM
MSVPPTASFLPYTSLSELSLDVRLSFIFTLDTLPIRQRQAAALPIFRLEIWAGSQNHQATAYRWIDLTSINGRNASSVSCVHELSCFALLTDWTDDICPFYLYPFAALCMFSIKTSVLSGNSKAWTLVLKLGVISSQVPVTIEITSTLHFLSF